MLFQKKSTENRKQERKNEKSKKSIQQLIPIKDLSEGMLITPDKRMIQLLKVSAVNMDLMGIGELNESFEIFEGFLSSLEYPVQITNVSMPVDLKSYIKDKENQYKDTTNPEKRKFQKSYIEYAKDIESRQDIMQRERYLIFSEKMKEDTEKERYETSLILQERKDEILSSLNELELKAEEVNDLDVLQYFHTMFDYKGATLRPIEDVKVQETITRNEQLTPKQKKKTPPAMTWKDMISPAPIFEEKTDYIRLGENFARTFLVIDFPRSPKGNFLSKLYRFKGNLTISTHLVPKPSDDYIKQTDRSLSELKTEMNGTFWKMKESTRLELENKAKAATETLEKMMSGNNNTIFHVHMYLHLQAPDLDELERASKRLRANCRKRGLRIEPATMTMIDGFQSVLPTMNNKLPEMTFRNFDSEAASSLFPFDESELFHEGGLIKGINLTTDSLVKIDQKALTSHNEFVVGQTGMGKSFYLMKDMIRKWQDGDRVFAIDPEGEISKMVKRQGGQVIKMSPLSRTVVNIMEIKATMDSASIDEKVEEEEEEELPLLFQKVQRLKIFFKLIKKKMEIVEQAQLEKAILNTYAKKDIHNDSDFTKFKPNDFPILEDLYDEINTEDKYEHLQDFKEVLYMYVHGSNSRMFNGHTNVDLTNDFITFDLKELEEESDSQAAAMYNALSFLWDEITGYSEKFTWLYIDECHTLSDPDNPRAMKFVYQIYKRIRKYYGGAVVATQQVADYLSAQEGHRNYGQAIIGNSISQLILPLKSQDIADLKNNEVLDLSEEEEVIISKFKQGEGIYVVGNNRVHMKVDHTPEEMKAINPKKYESLYGRVEHVS